MFALNKLKTGDNGNSQTDPSAFNKVSANAGDTKNEYEALKNYEKDLADLLSLIKEKYPQTKDWEGIADNIETADSDLAAKCKEVKETRANTHKLFYSKKDSVPSIPYRFYLWEKFYKAPIIDADIESEPDEFKDRIFSYICKIDPMRILETAYSIDADSFQGDAQKYPTLKDISEYLNNIEVNNRPFYDREG